MKDALLHAIGVALDGLEVGYCAFDSADLTLAWNATFLDLFPEHDGLVYRGEPYAANLRRFYSCRLDVDELPLIEQYITEGIARHRAQRRPYEFDHRDYRVRVSSFEIGRFGRVRVWRKVAMLPTRVAQPISTTQALQRLDAAAVLERLGDGVLVVDVSNHVLWANAAFADLYGLHAKTAIAGMRFADIYHLAWSGLEADSAYRIGCTTLTESEQFSGAPFELPLPSSRWVRIVEQRGEIDGRGYFVHADVTHIKQQQAARIKAEERYRLLAEYSSDIILLAEDGLLTYASPAVTELLGWQVEQVLGRPLVRFCHAEDIGAARAALQALPGKSESDYRARVLHCDGHYVWVEARARNLPVAGDSRAPRYVINVRGIMARKAVEDELARAQQRLETLATTDPLTGMANRRKLNEALRMALALVQRDGRPISVLMVDVDHFKHLNDSHGHQVGDAVLQRLANLLCCTARRTGDLAA